MLDAEPVAQDLRYQLLKQSDGGVPFVERLRRSDRLMLALLSRDQEVRERCWKICNCYAHGR